MHIRIFFSLLALVALNASAGFVMSGRIGASWAEVGHNSHVSLVSTEPAADYFKTTEETSSRLVLGVFLGPEYFFYQDKMRWQLGVAYYANPNPYHTQGIRYAYGLPDEGNIAYEFEVFSQRLLFENKYLFGFTDRVFGYILGGLGAAFNQAEHYHEWALSSTTVANGDFENYTYTAFTYTLGLGLEVEVMQQMRLGFGYQFSDLGKVSLGDYNHGNLDEAPSHDHTPTQEIILLLSYIF